MKDFYFQCWNFFVGISLQELFSLEVSLQDIFFSEITLHNPLKSQMVGSKVHCKFLSMNALHNRCIHSLEELYIVL